MNKPIIPIAMLLVLAFVLVMAISSNTGGIRGDDIASFAYLAIIGGLIGTWALAEMRGNLGQSLKHLLIWALLLVLVAAAYHYKGRFGF